MYCWNKNQNKYQSRVFPLCQENMTLFWRHQNGCTSLVHLASASESKRVNLRFLPLLICKKGVSEHLCLPAGVWRCAGKSSLGRSRQLGTGPCWQWCCGGRKPGPPPWNFPSDPARHSVLGIWQTRKGHRLKVEHWETEKQSEHR